MERNFEDQKIKGTNRLGVAVINFVSSKVTIL